MYLDKNNGGISNKRENYRRKYRKNIYVSLGKTDFSKGKAISKNAYECLKNVRPSK